MQLHQFSKSDTRQHISPIDLISSLLIEKLYGTCSWIIILKKAMNYNFIHPLVTIFIFYWCFYLCFLTFFFFCIFSILDPLNFFFIPDFPWNNNNKLSNSACWCAYTPERTESNSSTPTDNPLQIQLSPSTDALLRHRDPQIHAGESWNVEFKRVPKHVQPQECI